MAAPARVLDAGCGKRQDYVAYPENAHVVGLDVSADALAQNDRVDEKIVGDIQKYPLDAESFDLIVCWWVLEHLPCPLAALENMARALKPGGRMIIAVPNVLSVKGLITKFTPTGFHVWARRRFFGYEEAPNQTYLDLALRVRGLRMFALRAGLEIDELRVYGPNRKGFIGLLMRNSEIYLALRKPVLRPCDDA